MQMSAHNDPKSKTLLDRSAAALRAIRDLDPELPSSKVALLLEVARSPGLGPSEYARRLGSTQAVISRSLRDLGEINRLHEPGLGLVYAVIDKMDSRHKPHYLTPKGEDLIGEYLIHLRGGIS